ncbi:sensor histidine kinase [Azonexus hydrophilus]|jgi:signal transduction histidine kinase|uniref:histidine kinase n=1 Tax=Azonexus hydrophilus TaxID=418702 RepID=A0ABZ2XJ11_9RHOO|nr:sensor histidine kinase [Dechloromonas sp.]
MKAGSTSLRFRLLVGTLVWVAATVGIAGWVLQSMFEQQLSRQFDNELSMHLAQLAAHLETDAGGNPVLARPLSDPRLERPYSGLYWQVERMAPDNSGVIALRSRSLWDAQLPVPADRLADGERHTHRVSGPDGEALRMLEQVMQPAEGPDQSWRLIVAADERLLAEPVARFRTLLIGALALLALGLMVAAAFQVVAGLRPLKRLREELSLLRDGRRTTLSEDHPSEIEPVVDELNAVLSRNADFVTRARHQAGNLAHAVKTPLAVMANAAAEADGPFAELVHNQVIAARQQIDRHLALARVAAAAQDKGLRCQVAPVIEGLVRVMQRVHPERSFTFTPGETAREMLFRGEAQDLQEMLGNLLDNAGKWACSQIRIAISADAEQLHLDIDDDGPGIPVDRRAALLQRGQRGDEKVAGAGLGLAIVSELATLYQGQLELLDAPGGGLRARLKLPLAR